MKFASLFAILAFVVLLSEALPQGLVRSKGKVHKRTPKPKNAHDHHRVARAAQQHHHGRPKRENGPTLTADQVAPLIEKFPSWFSDDFVRGWEESHGHPKDLEVTPKPTGP